MANFNTTSQGGRKEDLANWISNISRDMTPFMSSIGKGKASQTLHEWSTDTLAEAQLQAAAEGSDFKDSAGPVIQKLNNRTQIFTKGITVSGTLESEDKVGRKSEFKYQTEKRGKEMARDVEATLISAQVNTASATAGAADSPTEGYTTGARLMGGYQSFAGVGLASSSSTDGDSGGAGTGTAVNATPGTGASVWALDADTGANADVAGAFSLDDINEVLRQINGETSATPNKVMMSTANKVKFSNLVNSSGLNTVRNIDEKGKLRQSVDLYESDFGNVEIVHNYLMGDGEVFVYDPSQMSVNTLRPTHFRNINETGDSLRSYMVQEITFEAKSPTGNGIIVGCA